MLQGGEQHIYTHQSVLSILLISVGRIVPLSTEFLNDLDSLQCSRQYLLRIVYSALFMRVMFALTSLRPLLIATPRFRSAIYAAVRASKVEHAAGIDGKCSKIDLQFYPN